MKHAIQSRGVAGKKILEGLCVVMTSLLRNCYCSKLAKYWGGAKAPSPLPTSPLIEKDASSKNLKDRLERT